MINGKVISSVDSLKYLEPNVVRNLTWSSHVTHITNKAHRTLAYLRHNIALSPPSVNLLAPQTLVIPKLEYACSIWDPHKHNLSRTLESVQNRAARFIFLDYS